MKFDMNVPSPGAVIAILSAFLSSATLAAAIDVPTPSVPPPLVRPLPIKIGLCVTPLLRAAHLLQVKREVRLEAGNLAPGDATWQIGKAIGDAFSTAMQGAFTEVVVLAACSPESALPRDVAAMIIPDLISAESRVSGSSRAAADVLFRHGQLDLRITLQSTTSASAVSWNVSGVAAIRHGPFEGNREEVIGRALSAALLSGCARFIADLYLKPEVHEWLIAQSLPNEVLK